MSHKLYVKSLREPISISKAEGEAISILMADLSKDGRTPVVIEGVWTGTKGEIKFVKYPEREKEDLTQKRTEAMSPTQAKLFESQILPHKVEAEVSGFGTITWTLFYMQARGAIKIDMYEPPKRHKKKDVRLTEIVINPTLYPILQQEIASYDVYLSNRAYAKQQREKELEKMALQEA